MSKLQKGRKAEDLARRILLSKGYKLISSGTYVKNGEIDLIMLDNDFIVFVEVKSKNFYSEFSLYKLLTKKKKNRLKKSIKRWIFKNRKEKCLWRLDYVGIEYLKDGKIKYVHFKNLTLK